MLPVDVNFDEYDVYDDSRLLLILYIFGSVCFRIVFSF